jgi:hypothetical protein
MQVSEQDRQELCCAKLTWVTNTGSGFRATRIVAVEPQVLREEDFLPVAATDQEIQSELQETPPTVTSPATYGEKVSQDAGWNENRLEKMS